MPSTVSRSLLPPVNPGVREKQRGMTIPNEACPRIAVIGNAGSYGYRLCRWLREYSDTASLILLRGKDNHERDLPGNVDECANDANWIHEYNRLDERFHTLDKHFDVALTVGPSGLRTATMLNSLPVVHFAMGSDLHGTTLEFPPSRNNVEGLCQRVYYRLFKSHGERSRRTTALSYQEGLRSVRAIIAVHPPMVNAAVQLGHQDKIRAWPFPEDVMENQRRVDQEELSQLNRRYENCDRVCLWLSRLNSARSTDPAYKGADVFLEAFSQVVGSGDVQVRAVVGEHGEDVTEFKAQAESLGVAKHIDYVPHLPFRRLLTYMAIQNAVVCGPVNQHAVFEGLIRESTSLGTPSISSFNPKLLTTVYGDNCPLSTADNIETYANGLSQLARMSAEQFSDLRVRVLAWANKSLDTTCLVPYLIRLLSEAVYLDSLSKLNRT